MIPILRLLRPKQWTKNLLVFAALLFTGTFKDPSYLTLALIAFASMCAASSATYIFNDLQDAERDRAHPKKQHRPIASGAVSPSLAIALGLILALVGLGLAFWLGTGSLLIVVTYLVIQVLYNAGLKRVPVADVYAIAFGFVLRAALGAAAINVKLSGWLLFCTGALALMLGFGKRRHEFIQQGEERATTRQSLVHYNRVALDGLVIMFATAAALCYGLYTLESQTAQQYPGIILTAPFVFYGITRYVLLVFTSDEGGEPEEVLFRDPHLLFSIAFFVLAAGLAIMGFRLPLLER
ncbi:MAG: decaprenyl-phosphate phosphoribosyltransferase [Fimbriimonas sp.]